jgi:hypothetical protein
MNLRKIKKKFKAYDGGVLKFEDVNNHNKYYFEMNYMAFKPIYKKLRLSIGNLYVVLSSDSDHIVFRDFEEIEEQFGFDENQIGRIIKFNNKTYGICDKIGILTLLENMECPEKDRIKYHEETFGFNVSDLDNEFDDYASNNDNEDLKDELFPRLKPIKAKEFDWDEAYAEGLRLFDDDIDQAETYADDMKYKKTGRY